MLVDNFKNGDKIIVTYRPIPYLGVGIQEPVVVEGTLTKNHVRGSEKVILKNDAGKVILEMNAMDIESIKSAPAPEARMAAPAASPAQYNVKSR